MYCLPLIYCDQEIEKTHIIKFKNKRGDIITNSQKLKEFLWGNINNIMWKKIENLDDTISYKDINYWNSLKKKQKILIDQEVEKSN